MAFVINYFKLRSRRAAPPDVESGDQAAAKPHDANDDNPMIGQTTSSTTVVGTFLH